MTEHSVPEKTAQRDLFYFGKCDSHHQFVLSVERYRKSRFGGIFYRAAVRVPEEGAGQPGGHGILG